jgi:hypothetical protein
VSREVCPDGSWTFTEYWVSFPVKQSARLLLRKRLGALL